MDRTAIASGRREVRIGGIQKHSLIDFPGQVAAVVFLDGCNFECPYCHNPQLTGDARRRAPAVALAAAHAFLVERRGFLDGIVVSGGEPTLQPGLPEFCRRLKALGYAVKLDTNGSRPKMLRRLIREGLLDYVAMDIKTVPERYPEGIARRCDAAALSESIDLIMASGLAYEFRTTCVAPLVDADVVARIARRIQGGRRYVLQPFRGGRLLHPAFFGGRPPAVPPAEMERLRAIAAPWVEACRLG